ncbi:hypothetical protein L3Y34_009815 [Caenorhabditis briggsae]|uniref:glucuronosyltransferase n=1 Tax=Caenorhabditis briggsae TaxID=6238 RepID=A0AAE9A6J3_CAEBR|nr:hypothetical protein L3Y34_009815 [Caenorhabditis briggsae]
MEKSSYEESIENVQNVLMRLENKTFLIHFVLNLLSIVINFFHLIVLTQKTMRTSSINILISGIAICDLFTMFTWVYKYLSLADLEYPECITATSLIKIYMDVTSWSSQYHFRRTTCWLGIVMASIRYVIMSRISDVRHFKWADPKMGYILIVIVFGSSGVLTVIWQWECQVVENRNYSLVANCAEHQEINGNYKFSVTLRPFANLGHYVIVRTYFILDATLSNFIPCIAFPTLTFLLFRQIQKINETRETIRRNSTTTEDNEEKYVLSVKLIVFITINFFIAEAPIGTIAILKTFLERTDKLFHIAHHLHRANFICSFISVIINIFHFIILSRKSMRTSSTNVIMIGIAISDISTMLSTIYKHYFLVDVESPECVTASVRYKIYLDLSAWTFQDHYRRCSSWLGVLMAIVRLFVMKTMPNSSCAEYQDINSRPPFSVILTPLFSSSNFLVLRIFTMFDAIVTKKSEEMKLDPITVDNITATYWHITVNSKGGHSLFEPVHKLTVQSCRSLFSNSELLETLRAHEYDVGIAEPLMTCSLALFRHLKIEKVILASSCPNYDSVMAAMGEPADTSYVPSIFSEVSGDRMDFADRLENYDMYSFMIERYSQMYDDEAKVYRRFLGEDFPDWRELIPDASVHFTNSIPYLDFPRPSIRKTIDIGGISVDLEKIQSETLNGDFDRILDLREKTMFISFGTLAKSSEMPKNYKENLLEVFKSEPNTTFIWKYEHDDVRFAESLENLELVKWAPQTALLNDKRLSAFLSHGGLGSTIETVFFGKPTIMPIKPKELVVKYTEFVGNYGPFHHMTPYSLKMPWIQRYGYDVLLFKIGAILAPVVLLAAAFKLFLRRFFVSVVKKNK